MPPIFNSKLQHPNLYAYEGDSDVSDDTNESMISFRLEKLENLLMKMSKNIDRNSDLYGEFLTKNIVREPQNTLFGENALPSCEIAGSENALSPKICISKGVSRFIPIEEKIYYIENEKKQSWSGADDECRLMGGVLFSPRNAGAWETLRMNLEQNKNYWTDIRVNVSFVLGSSDEKAQFLDFDPYSPSRDTCIEIGYKSHHLMNEVHCNTKNYYVCKLG